MSETNLRDLFSKNRAENIGYDLWNHFVVPPFFDKLSIASLSKPNIFVGGRGCGKTMLLRYLCHKTAFSDKRKTLPHEPYAHIGLYWRIDTQFASLMQRRNVEEDIWQSAFYHLAALQLGIELLESLKSISNNDSTSIEFEDIQQLNFSISAFNNELPAKYSELFEFLEQQLWQFESWLNNVRKNKNPNFLPGQRFVYALIKVIRRQLPELNNASFFVYVDEYENLLENQKRIINSWLKHSESPLIFNLAMKRNAFTTKETLGNESLALDHDYNQHDLEYYLFEESNFRVFAAEILLLQLSKISNFDSPIDTELLVFPKYLKDRRNKHHKDKVIKSVQKIFPDLSNEELANRVVNNDSLCRKLKDRIGKALDYKNSDLKIKDFFDENYPEACIILPALLYRKRQSPEEVLDELIKLKNGKRNKFSGTTAWIHNNFIGALLQLYEPHSRTCPFYSGFRTFCFLSKGNIRHFLELCHKSMIRASLNNISLGEPIPPEEQAEAARETSASFLGEVKTFGKYGNKLHMFLLRIGSIFQLAHGRRTLSEPETTHFSITGGTDKIFTTDNNFLEEASKWSVLFQEKETKQKSSIKLVNNEYILNPIYAPYFHISYRKKRLLQFTSDEMNIIIEGSFDEFKMYIKKLSKKWKANEKPTHPSLFSQIMDNE